MYKPIPRAFEPQTIITRAGAGKIKAGCGEDHLLLGHKVPKPLHHSVADTTVLRAYPENRRRKKEEMLILKGQRILFFAGSQGGKADPGARKEVQPCAGKLSSERESLKFSIPPEDVSVEPPKKGDLCDPNPAAVRK